MLRDKKWKEIDSVMYKEEKIYVPKDDKLRAEIIKLYYDIPVGDHGGQCVTVVPWTSSHILYGLPLHQKGNISKTTC